MPSDRKAIADMIQKRSAESKKPISLQETNNLAREAARKLEQAGLEGSGKDIARLKPKQLRRFDKETHTDLSETLKKIL
ncbi:MAG: hypothetical protein ABIC19_04470 [Patescibacteria group bacterium]|nr:hypothetical protein [Patescibacteria group bacterium]